MPQISGKTRSSSCCFNERCAGNRASISLESGRCVYATPGVITNDFLESPPIQFATEALKGDWSEVFRDGFLEKKSMMRENIAVKCV